MKVKTVSVLTVGFATAFMALPVPAVSAQRNNGTFVGAPQPQSAPASQRPINPIPFSVILPMSNPVGPMGNPVQPIIRSPFIRYSDSGPTVVMPEQSRGNRGNSGRGRDRDVILVPVAGPAYYYPPSYNYYPELETATVTVPGRLPASRYDRSPNSQPVAPPASVFTTVPQPEVYSEPRMIINEPRPNRVIVPPAIGTPRSDVVARLGQPWGTISARGQETLYFDGVVVVFAAGRVIQVR